MHNDPARAKTSPWREYLVFDTEGLEGVGLPLVTSDRLYTLNYGFDRVLFSAVLRIGAQARAHFILDEVRKRGADAYLVKSTYSVEAENSEGPCIVAQQLSLFLVT